MFLLLIFFMVSSTFKSQLGIDIALPKAEGASSQEVTSYEITVDRDGAIFFGETPVSEDVLRETLRQVVTDEPNARLVLRADERADFGPVIRAVDIAREVGGERLVIPTAPLESPTRATPIQAAPLRAPLPEGPPPAQEQNPDPAQAPQ